MKPCVAGQMVIFSNCPMSAPAMGFFADGLNRVVDRSTTVWKARQGSGIGIGLVDI
jgi:hypothetical protein